jgi:hypothetical protein
LRSTAHKGLHAEIPTRGACKPGEHAKFDTRVHQAFYNGVTPREVAERRAIPRDEGSKGMDSEEMSDVAFRDAQSRAYIKRMDIQGKAPVKQARADTRQSIRDHNVNELGNTPPKELPKAEKSTDQAAKDEAPRRSRGMDLWGHLPGDDSPGTLPPAKADEEQE